MLNCYKKGISKGCLQRSRRRTKVSQTVWSRKYAHTYQVLQHHSLTSLSKILDNLQITVKNIHIRYEDSLSTPGVGPKRRGSIRETLLTTVAPVFTRIHFGGILGGLHRRELGTQLHSGQCFRYSQTCQIGLIGHLLEHGFYALRG